MRVLPDVVDGRPRRRSRLLLAAGTAAVAVAALAGCAQFDSALGQRQAVVTFEVVRPENLAWKEILASLKNQTYVRVLAARSLGSDLAVHRVDDLIADPAALSGTIATLIALRHRDLTGSP